MFFYYSIKKKYYLALYLEQFVFLDLESLVTSAQG